jgi:hypothetical protein
VAGIVKTEETPQLIEILDDESGVFGVHEAAPATAPDGGRRWIAPVAGLALVGLIAYGVVSSASGNEAPEAAPVTTGTTVHRATTVPATTSPVPAPRAPYYAAEPPRQFKLISVEENDQAVPMVDSGGYQLWTKPGTSGAQGEWFSLNYYFGAMGESIATNAYRIDTGNGHTLVSITAPGRLGVQLGDASGTLDIESFGWSAADLLALAQSVTVDAGVPSFPPSSLTDGYEMASSVDPWMALEGVPVEQIFYAASDDPTSSLSLMVSPVPDMDAAEFANARQVAVRALLDHATAFTVDGVPGVAGVAGQVIGGDFSLATWLVDDYIVSLSARMTAPQLIEIAQSVHTVSDAEFRGMQFQAIHNTSELNATSVQHNVTNSVPLWTQTMPSGQELTISVGMETNGSTRLVDWWWGLGSGGYSTTATDTAQINTFVDSQRTFVLADLPRTAAGAVATLRISHDGAAPVEVPFVDTDPTLDRVFAAYAFVEDGPYSAQIVGPDGTVLVTWPPS